MMYYVLKIINDFKSQVESEQIIHSNPHLF